LKSCHAPAAAVALDLLELGGIEWVRALLLIEEICAMDSVACSCVVDDTVYPDEVLMGVHPVGAYWYSSMVHGV